MYFNFNRDYPKKDIPAIVGITKDQTHQWAALSPIIKPVSKKHGGMGRPLDNYSLVNVYQFAIFKELIIKSGLSRKMAEHYIRMISDRDIKSLIAIASKFGVDTYFEKVYAFWRFRVLVDKDNRGEISTKYQEIQKIKESVAFEYIRKKEKLEDPGIRLFLAFFRNDDKILHSKGIVWSKEETKDRVLSALTRFDSMFFFDEARIANAIHFLNFGQLIGDINHNIRFLYAQDDYWEWFDNTVGEEILEFLLS